MPISLIIESSLTLKKIQQILLLGRPNRVWTSRQLLPVQARQVELKKVVNATQHHFLKMAGVPLKRICNLLSNSCTKAFVHQTVFLRLIMWSGSVLCCLLLIGCSSAIDDEWESYQTSVIRLVADTVDGMTTGTAFAINDQGYYATNYHVIEPAKESKLSAVESLSPASKVHSALVVWSNPEQDLAIVHVPSWPNPALTIFSPGNVKVNLPVLSVGFPGSSDVFSGKENPAWTIPTLKRGIISESLSSTLKSGGQVLGLYEHSAVVNSGNSGGPLVDECGRVVGVNVAKATSSFDVGNAVKEATTFGVNEASIDIQEGAFFAIKAEELVAVLISQSLDFNVSNRPCLGERLSPTQFLTGLFGLVALFSMALFFLFMYFRKKLPNQKISLGSLSKMILPTEESGFDSGPVALKEPVKSSTGGKVYRGEGGEIIHTNTVQLECIAGNCPFIKLIPGQSVKLGRDNAVCDIGVLNEHVSREHAKLTLTENGLLFVVDLKSTSGTYLDARKVPDEPPGMEMKIGSRLLLGSEGVVYMRLEDTAS